MAYCPLVVVSLLKIGASAARQEAQFRYICLKAGKTEHFGETAGVSKHLGAICSEYFSYFKVISLDSEEQWRTPFIVKQVKVDINFLLQEVFDDVGSAVGTCAHVKQTATQVVRRVEVAAFLPQRF